MKKNRLFVYLTLILFSTFMMHSCATFSVQKGKSVDAEEKQATNAKITHEFILVGDAGNAEKEAAKKNFDILQKRLREANKQATLLFLGDNIYPSGMPDSLAADRQLAETKINAQLSLSKNFIGNTYFIAGNHDWYNGVQGWQEQKSYVANQLSNKKGFLPRKYEPIEALSISDSITLIAIDSEWLMQDWNRYKEINKGSTIKSREDFYEEFRSVINKNQNKITLVAIHHPLFTNGSHGGFFSLRGHLFPYKNIPLPILGSIGNFLRKTTGASPADVSFSNYQEMIQRMKTIAKDYTKVIFISGHEHSLQYIENEGIKQIISGSASKTEEARARQSISFSAGKIGYAVLTVDENQQVNVAFYTTENGFEEKLFETVVLEKTAKPTTFPHISETFHTSSVYPKEATQKSKFYTFLFGQHYRQVFGTPVQAPVANLDTLYGGLTPLISGGGNQSLSLRLVDATGKQFVMRGLKKSAPQFLQTALLKNKYIKDRVKNASVIGFIEDFYTTSHPYMPFVIGDLLDSIQVYHSNPKLFYIPKQSALGAYNDRYGDELYMIEERQHKSQVALESYGFPKDIISTEEMIANLEKDTQHQVDSEMYLRARIFDILIGDWDRHGDQWRWGVFEEEDKTIYRPIPRDRDQVFAKIDGHLLSLINKLPALRHMQNFSEKFASPRWINKTAFPLDKVILQNTTEKEWKDAAQYVASQIHDENIRNAFALLPKEVQNMDTENIQDILQKRRDGLVKYVETYRKELMKYGVVFGTNKKDIFEISTAKDEVKIDQYRLKKKEKQFVTSYTYQANTTKEVWVYGLDDQDSIQINGDKSGILLRVIGGRDEDTFDVHSKNKVFIYDFASEKSILTKSPQTKVIERDNYQLNLFDYKQAPINTFTALPTAGYNPDNGFMLGFHAGLTIQKFKYLPFTSKHDVKAKIDFATRGVLASYSGLFKNNTRNWYYSIEASATTSHYSQNFFGWGNETKNQAKEYGLNYYRVRTEQISFAPSYQYIGRNGGSFLIGPMYESTEIEPTNSRFIDNEIVKKNEVYKTQHFAGGQLKYEFKNYDNPDNPSIGLAFLFHYGFLSNVVDTKENHQFISSKLNFVIPLNEKQSFAWSSTWFVKTLIGNTYHFYQAADLGANQGLRGYRNNRFVGQSAFSTSNDLKFKIMDYNQGFVPLSYGGYLGFDLGRVWQKNESTNLWHNSYGGGIWITALESLTFHLGLFKSTEDLMSNFGLGYHF